MDHRLFFEAVWWIARTGRRWRDLKLQHSGAGTCDICVARGGGSMTCGSGPSRRSAMMRIGSAAHRPYRGTRPPARSRRL